MAIDAFIPPLQAVLLQSAYLRHKILEGLEPELTFDRICDTQEIEAHIGEGATMTRAAILPPVTQDATPIAAGVDLNQGMTAQGMTYEQFRVTLADRRGMMTLSAKMDETKIASEFVRYQVALGQQAGSSRDVRAAQAFLPAYEGGNTWAKAVLTASVGPVAVDNIQGFDTQYVGWSAFSGVAPTQSPGVPVPVNGTTAKLPVRIIPANPATASTTANVVAVAADGTNASSAFSGGVFYGASGTLTFDAPVTLAIGDTIQALDGASILRPNAKTNRSQLLSTDSIALQQLARARAKLESRKVPKLPNGMYAVLGDANLFADLLLDPTFRQATQGTFNTSPYFKGGQVVAALGLEFITSSQVPVYPILGAGSGVVARHAIVCGKGAIVRAPSAAARLSAERAMRSPEAGAVDVRFVDYTKFVTRGPIDVLADTYTFAWEVTMGHVAPTDITSTPLAIASTDYARYKRAVVVEFASQA